LPTDKKIPAKQIQENYATQPNEIIQPKISEKPSVSFENQKKINEAAIKLKKDELDIFERNVAKNAEKEKKHIYAYFLYLLR